MGGLSLASITLYRIILLANQNPYLYSTMQDEHVGAPLSWPRFREDLELWGFTLL